MSNQPDETRILQIPLSSIDIADTRYRISKGDDDIAGLALSIKQNGLTSLPLVRAMGKSSDTYIVVAGFKRINALVHNGFKGNVVCQTLPQATEADYAVHAVSDNAFSRPLTPAELIKSILILTQFMDKNLIAEKSLSIFNTQLNPGYINDLQKIGTFLPQGGLKLMDDGRLSIKSAKKISGEPPGLANCFVSLFSAIKTSSSKQMEIITNFLEIAARENISPMDLYQDKKIQDILVSDNKDLGFKGNLLRYCLIERRFPHLEKKRQESQKKINSLKLGPGIKLNLPDNFESTSYSLTFEFKNLADFTNRADVIDKVSKHPDLVEILKR
jgi:ParB family chromosome partitioning protein